MDDELEHDLTVAKTYFECMFECVVGCGCWEPGWDEPEAVARFARQGHEWADFSPWEALESLDRLDELAPEDLEAASSFLELHFEGLDAFRRFWAPSRAVLRATLEAV